LYLYFFHEKAFVSKACSSSADDVAVAFVILGIGKFSLLVS
jgi:hypothetical protein